MTLLASSDWNTGLCAVANEPTYFISGKSHNIISTLSVTNDTLRNLSLTQVKTLTNQLLQITRILQQTQQYGLPATHRRADER